jgi:hypothetical protein
MRNYPLYRAIIFCCLLFPCIAQSQIQKIYLHPKAAGGGKQSQFIDSIRFIPLEIKEGIQFEGYSNIQVTDKYFLITDYPGKILLLYSKNGSFIKKINFKKLDGNFYPNYDRRTNQIVFFGNNKNYTLTTKDQLKIKLDWNDPRNKKYFRKYIINLNDTSFTIQKRTPDENDIVYAYHFYKDFYWQSEIKTSSLYKDSMDYEFKIYQNNKLVKGFFPYNHINETRFLYANESVSFQQTDTPYIRFLTRPYCDTIYKMVRDSLSPAYQLVLPLENCLPSSFFIKPFKNLTERQNFNRNNGWMMRQVINFYETPKYLFFLVSYLSNYEYYIYDKKSNITYKAKNIKPDSSQYNVQLLGDFSAIRQGDKFYKTQKAGDLTSFFEQNKNTPVPKELENFLKSNPPATTPVIVEFKFKN